MQLQKHWEKIYTTKSAMELSWFQEHAELSLKLIHAMNVAKDAALIDVGGGASTLVDDLVAIGYNNVTVLDVSKAALLAAQLRLGNYQNKVKWLEANILEFDFPIHTYDVWHDRAVFHFLIQPEERKKYIHTVLRAVKPGGLIIIATFAVDGPDQCSGLPVIRYSAYSLHSEFGAAFTLLKQETESHHTPAGKEQKFIYCLCRKIVN